MHEYSTFWIQEEIRIHYFYKSDILHRFLIEYLSSSDRSEYLQSQFNYISRVLPYKQLLNCIQRFHNHQLVVEVRGNIVRLSKRNRIVTITMYEDNFTIKCESVNDADSLIFQPLKTFDPCFFIIEMGTSNSGWISPVKKEILL